ncbi:hypothetical protein [Tsukamurella pulmonis]|uniref:hypothetical protein n=1 Tax=Tsukamurella pulmonis TaxID=47312 RepID=UPI000E08EE8B|nr:hypothetical protein [Tsukamurella pulmonis]RDH11470.1 hypothetical protein DVB88_12630 [Tsukamurella pulmonis]
MTSQLRPRDATSRRAFAESIAPAAMRILRELDEASQQLQAIAAGNADTAPDPRTSLAAVLELDRAMSSVESAVDAYIAVCVLGGLTPGAASRGLNVRPSTLARRLAAHPLAAARGRDLVRADGTWSVHRPAPAAGESEPG